MTPRRQPGDGDGLLQQWRFSPAVWQGSRHLSRRQINALLRVRSASIIPGVEDRFVAMGLPGDVVQQTLRRVRSLDSWADVWTWTAQRYLGEARQRATANEDRAASMARSQAALSYHAATVLSLGDEKKTRTLRSASATLFAQSLPVVLPAAVRIEVPWRTRALPGYLVRPTGASRPPMVVVLNGATTTKEELLGWSNRFLDLGIGYLAIDWPGTGEAPRVGSLLDPESDDLTDGVIQLAEAHNFDVGRIALLGVGIGGALAVRVAAADRRVAACVTVSAPFDATAWIRGLHPLLSEQLIGAVADKETRASTAESFALPTAATRLRAPLLVLGSGRDVIVPPGEAARLAAAAGELGTLVWYPNSQHALYDAVTCWTDDAARWLTEILGPESASYSTRVEQLAPTARSNAVHSAAPGLTDQNGPV